MTSAEFVSKAVSDKNFLVMVCANIPDELLHQKQPEPVRTNDPEQKAAQFGGLYATYLGAAAREMGLGLDESDIRDECVELIGRRMGKLQKIKFSVRFITSLKKAGKGQRQPVARG